MEWGAHVEKVASVQFEGNRGDGRSMKRIVEEHCFKQIQNDGGNKTNDEWRRTRTQPFPRFSRW